MWLANRLFPSVRRIVAERDQLRRLVPPLPPPELQFRVGDTTDANTFLRVGAAITQDILWLLRAQNVGFGHAVLDFGCGCGRVSRWLDLGQRLYGADVDGEAIEWCRKTLPGTFAQTSLLPPLPYADGSFDQILAISVFTHLSEELGQAWLAELARVIEPGGLLIASVLGQRAFQDAAGAVPAIASQREELESTGHAFALAGQVPGMPAYYQQSYHLPDYVQKNWSEYFKVVAYEPAWIHHHHDAVVMRR